MTSFTDSVAIVTGAGAGIGRATAERFARDGAYVATVDRDPIAVLATLELIRGRGGDGVAIDCDVTQSDEIRAFIEKLCADRGAVHILVNNVGGRRRSQDWLRGAAPASAGTSAVDGGVDDVRPFAFLPLLFFLGIHTR